MNRRHFLAQTAAGALALSWPGLARPAPATRMGIVVHSYWQRWQAKTDSPAYPRFTNALDLLTHCHELGAGGIQVGVDGWTSDFARQIRDKCDKWGLYLEGSIALPKKPDDTVAFEQQLVRAKEAGVGIVRTVCSPGRRYETFTSLEAWQTFQKNAVAILQAVEPILQRHTMRLGVENHKDWRAHEMALVMKQLSSKWIGVTLDFGNNVALLDDPLDMVRTLAPYVVSTHIKDMAVEEYADGFRLSEVPLGQGILDLPAMIALCRQHNPAVTFSLEMITRDPLTIPCLTDKYWTTFADTAEAGTGGRDLARTLRLVRQHKPADGLPTVMQRSPNDRLAAEDRNIRLCLAYGREKLGL
ncbi:sugar phosphate isomerase/epimerase family protein [Spirosoma montaniterrae]|uniref:Xylose isomerase n=1 Tax=Spirosoma montaniterrae TaxID=1178516 RepID=A0A1P9WV39_9BACT|nr:sugar phosphate isomerase/epimerase family protein [Spirosoma montaniterrae]AQG79262.1 xylose isomerase [Spirosoma montaniterrae]